MKTLESIREEIWEEMLRLEDKRKDQWADIKYQTLRGELQKLGHLDEPEVLSQELPVIPKFVAEWIEEAKGRHHSLYEAMADYCSPEMNQWIQDFYHSDLFAKAWLNGYEIEQEPRYYAKIKGHENIASNDKYWNYNTDMEELSVGDSEVHPNVISDYILNATK